ncbi:hypothetical protein D9M72_274230 [compost metagenome]
MKKHLLSLALLSAMSLSTAHAAQGASGTINFYGSVVADTCVVSGGGAAGSGTGTISVAMGSTAIGQIGKASAPKEAAHPGSTLAPEGKDFELLVNCADAAAVDNYTLKISPAIAAGKHIGTPTGQVAIALFDTFLDNTGVALDFTPGFVTGTTAVSAGPTPATGPLQPQLSGDKKSATYHLRAYVVTANGDSTASVSGHSYTAAAYYTLSYN